MKVYFFMAILLAAVGIIIYLKYQKTKDIKSIFNYLGTVAVVVFFTYASKIIFVHKPIFVVHLAFLLLSWIALFYYLFKQKLNLWFLLSPAVTTILFVIIALFFRENG